MHISNKKKSYFISNKQFYNCKNNNCNSIAKNYIKFYWQILNK